MSELVDRIGATIKEKGLTFNRVEHDCGLGNGTIKRWGDQSPRLDKLVRVSEYLDVSLDYLVFGTLHSENSPSGEIPDLEVVKREQGLSCDGSPLDEVEATLSPGFGSFRPARKKTYLTLFTSNIKSTLRKRWSLSTGRMPKGNGRRKKRPFPGP